jgi:hypothetical protein
MGSTGSTVVEGESSKQGSPPTWNEDFYPIAFVAEHLKGTSSRLESLSLEELRKLTVGSGLKCLALNQMVFARQEAEAKERLEKEVKAAEEGAKREHVEALKKKKADFESGLSREKKRCASLKKDEESANGAQRPHCCFGEGLEGCWETGGRPGGTSG